MSWYYKNKKYSQSLIKIHSNHFHHLSIILANILWTIIYVELLLAGKRSIERLHIIYYRMLTVKNCCPVRESAGKQSDVIDFR